MKNIRWIFAALLLLLGGTVVLAQVPKPSQRLPSSQVIDYFVTLEETRVLAVADAMPADKYPFSPTSGEFKGVRTFAQQLKHAAADNYMLGAAILGEKPPADVGDETGPDSLRTKADVIQYIKDSFAYLHKAVATIDDKNMVIESPPISPMPKGSATRLGLAVEVLMHTFDHYGQLVEYQCSQISHRLQDDAMDGGEAYGLGVGTQNPGHECNRDFSPIDHRMT